MGDLKSQLSETELLAAVIKKKQCNAKAHSVVEAFLEAEIPLEDFLEKLNYISSSHYNDVVEERTLLSLCGYPLCSKTLDNVPSKRYQISPKNKKVYDITERKKFCSSSCFKASIYICSQIPSTPLWLRSKDDRVEYKVL